MTYSFSYLEHYVIIKWSVPQEDVAILNVYPPSNRIAMFMKQNSIELKGEINRSTIINIIGDFNTLS